MAERSAVYFPMMRRKFEEGGGASGTYSLSMIESGLVPTGKESCPGGRSVGNLFYATGAHYGLEANWWIDERRDPEKAHPGRGRVICVTCTIPGANGIWHWAAYNVSPRRIRYGIRRAGGQRELNWGDFPLPPPWKPAVCFPVTSQPPS